MKLWEVIKELTDDPTKRFERKDRYKHWIIGTDVVDGEVIRETYYFMLDCDGEDSFGGNIATNEDDWQLVRQPVTWQEAFQAWIDGCYIRCEGGGRVSKFKNGSLLLDTLECPPSKWMMKNGKWYVEE